MIDLETRLVDLGSRIDWPVADVAGEVRSQLIAGRRRQVRPSWVLAAAFIAACLLAFGTPGGRSAVADVLGVVGIEIRWSDTQPPPASHRDLALGEPVTVEVALEAVDHELLVPGTDVGPPDAVYLEGGRVSMVWVPTAELPEVGDSGVGLLQMQFVASLDTSLLSKQLLDGTNISAVEVRGSAGFWIEGQAHVLAYVDPDGAARTDATRLAGNVLVWEGSGVTHRLESVLSLEETLALAESLSPLDSKSSLDG